MQAGAQAGVAHVPFVQTAEPQSAPAPQRFPSTQLGEHAGGAHEFAVQTPEAQSVATAHRAPSTQLGEHAGGAQLPRVHTPEAQSSPAAHAAPSRQAGVHAESASARAPSRGWSESSAASSAAAETSMPVSTRASRGGTCPASRLVASATGLPLSTAKPDSRAPLSVEAAVVPLAPQPAAVAKARRPSETPVARQGMSAETMLLQQRQQVRPVHSSAPRGFGRVPAPSQHERANVRLLEARHGVRARIAVSWCRFVFEGSSRRRSLGLCGREPFEQRALDRVPQLTHVAWP